MANTADELEDQKTLLVSSLSSVAEAMRNCANLTDHFAKMLAHVPAKSTSSTKRKAKEMEDDGEGKPKKKRQPRKARDPNEPKRPASAYILFQNDIRKELKSQHPGITQTELLNLIAKQWTEMTEDQKLIYTQINKSAKEKYSVDKAAYEATKTPGADAVTTPAPIEKKVVKAPVKATPKPEFKSAPLVQSSASSVSSDESSEDDDDDDNDDEEVEEEEEEKPALKKKKATPLVATPALKEKKQRKH